MLHDLRKKISVTGANGQLANCILKISEQYEHDYQFEFLSIDDLDITDESAVEEYFDTTKPHFCINASAYTAVDLAEKEEDKAYNVNTLGVEYLAKACNKVGTTFIHRSTDYVFDGDTQIPYDEDNFTAPINAYGLTKLYGENLALENNPKTIVIRTSWLYSEFNKNFVKTMLNLFQTKDKLSIVADQFGQPTNANDLAETIMKIIESPKKIYGIFHFSNYPETTWFDFAKKIAELSKSNISINPISTEEYPTPAKRPQRSTLSLDKIEKVYKIDIKHWENSLEECVEILSEKSE